MEDSQNPALELLPYLRVHKDGTIQRLAGTQITPSGFDPQTGVQSKDIIIIPETAVSARLYRPTAVKPHQKLPVAVYFHGGAFCIASTADPVYHNSLNLLVAEAQTVVVSVNYRLAPEHPLPAAYDDSWAALEWLADQARLAGEEDGGQEPWLRELVDFQKVYLVGDSAGANISHHMAMRIKNSNLLQDIKLVGIALIHPYFWGEKPIGSEITDHLRKAMVDGWWKFVCPSERGSDDWLINPFAEGAPAVEGVACENVLVIVAEKDILRDRGKLYYEKLVNSGWKGKVEMMETEGEDHVFHIFNPSCEKAKVLIKRLASFTNLK